MTAIMEYGTVPHTPRRRFRPWMLFVVLLPLAFLAGWLLVPHGGDAGAGVKSAHGPFELTEGVPHGYTRDIDGAATAGINLLQAITQAGQGKVTVDAVRASLVVPNPGPELSAALDAQADRPDSPDALNVQPLIAVVTDYSNDAATVHVWGLGLSQSAIEPGDPASLMQHYATSEIRLVWVDGDWRAQEKTGAAADAPPVMATEPPWSLPAVQGYYSTLVN